MSYLGGLLQQPLQSVYPLSDDLIASVNQHLLVYWSNIFPTVESTARLWNFLRDTNSVIAGSFVMQCLYSTYWDGSDIDIFVPLHSRAALNVAYTAMKDNFYVKKGIIGYLRSFRRIKGNREYFFKSYSSTYVGPRIEFIFVDVRRLKTSLVEHIQQTHDLVITTNCLTRDGLHVSSDGLLRLNDRITTHNLHTLPLGKFTHHIDKVANRFDKYTQRGITILEPEVLQDVIQKIGRCSLCQNTNDYPNFQTKCGHFFHTNCLIRLTSDKKKFNLDKTCCSTCKTQCIAEFDWLILEDTVKSLFDAEGILGVEKDQWPECYACCYCSRITIGFQVDLPYPDTVEAKYLMNHSNKSTSSLLVPKCRACARKGFCFICLGYYEPNSITSCGHNFHDNCLASQLDYQKGDKINIEKSKCPVCRSIIRENITSICNFTGYNHIQKTRYDQLDLDNFDYYICESCHHYPYRQYYDWRLVKVSKGTQITRPIKCSYCYLIPDQCSICLEKISADGLTWPRSDRQISCGHFFHNKCIEQHISYRGGELVQKYKSQCPSCRQPIIDPEALDISGLDLDTCNYYICQKCNLPFKAETEISSGYTRCQLDQPQHTNIICQNCEKRYKFQCPNCGLELEHLSGCMLFACCLYGRDRCLGDNCDHGSTESIKFCGHRWVLNE